MVNKMIKIKNICKKYEEGSIVVEALKNINLEFESNGITAIIGRSGSGKSTLLNLIGALDKPTSGNIFFDDVDITNLEENELLQFRNKKIGYIFQNFYLEPALSTITNISLPLIIRGIPKKEREEEALKLIKKLNLDGKEKQITLNLSGGEKQRVCICRALINNPDLILADEPTGNLDYENGQNVMGILKEISKDRKVILVTHNLDDAKKYANRIINLSDGEIIEDIKNEI